MKKMKSIATSLLVLALIGAIIALPYRDSFAGGLIFAACGAALVGALADWFAVVALFRHPLGMKFPHTAIIPNNRGRIIEGIVAIVEKDWLSQEFIRGKIFSYPLIDRLAAALHKEEGRRELDRLAQSVLVAMLRGLDPQEAGQFIQLLLKNNLAAISISPNLLEQLEAAFKKIYADDLIRLMLNWAIGAADGDEFRSAINRILQRAAADYSSQGNLFRRLSKGLGESLNILNYQEAGAALAHSISLLLFEMQDTDNPYHIKVKTELEKLKIADSESAAEKISEILKKIVDSEVGLKAASEIIAVLKTQMLVGSKQEMPMIHRLTNMAVEQIDLICQDELRKEKLETRLKTELIKILARYHGVIGQIVREKLASLNDIGLVKSLEDKVGDDLQWIRINGTVIGALIGALQFLILHWF